MKIGRHVPPAAAPLCWTDLCSGIAGILSRERSVPTLEEEIRRQFGVRHVFLVSSGTAALTLTLSALKALSPRTEVVIPAYTCFSVPAAVLKAGLRPVLCDIDPSTFDFNHALLEEALNANTLCVIAHHLFGIPSDIDRLRALCETRGIFVLEDAAQAMGAESRGRRLGTLGDAGIFSLGRGKNITCGSGGIIMTDADRIAEAVGEQHRRLRPPSWCEVLNDLVQIVGMTIFTRPRLYWIPAAMPFLRLGQTIFPKDIPLRRLSGMKAAFLRSWPSRLKGSNQARSEAAAYFSRQLPLRLPPGPPHPYLRLPILVGSSTERERIFALAQARGLGVGLGYPTPVNEIPEIRTVFNGRRYPAARRVADSLLTIPTHHWVSASDKKAIADFWRETRTGGETTDG
jgi:perosamine synthetase